MGIRNDVDIVAAQEIFHLLLNDLYALCPVVAAGVIRHDDLYREGDFAFQLCLGLIPVLLGQVLIKGFGIGELGQAADGGVVLAVDIGETVGSNGIVQLVLGEVRLCSDHGCITVETVEQRLAEVQVVDGDFPVIGFIFFVKVGIEVKGVEVAVSAGTVGTDDLAELLILHPLVDEGGGNGDAGDFPIQVLRSHSSGLGVVLVLDLFNVDVVGIPVFFVLGQYPSVLVLEGGHDVAPLYNNLVLSAPNICPAVPGTRHWQA